MIWLKIREKASAIVLMDLAEAFIYLAVAKLYLRPFWLYPKN